MDTSKKITNGNRVTLAILGEKVDTIAADVSSLRTEHDAHVARGDDVLQRLSSAETSIAQLTNAFSTIVKLAEGVADVKARLTIIMWGTPVVLTMIGLAATLIKLNTK